MVVVHCVSADGVGTIDAVEHPLGQGVAELQLDEVVGLAAPLQLHLPTTMDGCGVCGLMQLELEEEAQPPRSELDDD